MRSLTIATFASFALLAGCHAYSASEKFDTDTARTRIAKLREDLHKPARDVITTSPAPGESQKFDYITQGNDRVTAGYDMIGQMSVQVYFDDRSENFIWLTNSECDPLLSSDHLCDAVPWEQAKALTIDAFAFANKNRTKS